MWRDVRAELAKQAYRPASWLLLAIGVVLSATFAHAVPYAGYRGAASGAPGAGRGLAEMLPAQFAGNAIAGTPVFVGALALIFGVLVAGGEYGYATWKTVLVQQPSRATVYTAKLVTVAVGALLLVLALLAVSAAASAVIAALEDQPGGWPSGTAVLRGAGAGWLVTTMWGTLGVLLAVALRSVALPVGLGLVWLLAVQNLLAAIAAPLLDWVAALQKGLPGANAGSLVAALGAPTGTPGVAPLVGAGQAALVVAGYLAGFALLAGWLLRARDLD
ncbi:ABC-type transport system involved in multi-copper enzyme maturation permease subunit [Prauserella shujinwangii]|uniref:ABC-type transport system involved in multi-copper enzyme maturation permease subunit n=1 Tax=Prauserella shujinwangii TaxID=1453103 RepID=A0A2T0LKH5_9PSEU|nr:ABC transporter permease subunit [Prauserella shujinwangii]PRX43410.1 ABC-type transport system involved in multi-copper enzyme maturation permease subunit [Prauserella shujinwangii]